MTHPKSPVKKPRKRKAQAGPADAVGDGGPRAQRIVPLPGPPPAAEGTPRALGFRMPAEWEPHAATWLSWPRRDGISFPDSFDQVLPALREMVAALIESEPVCINVINGAHEAEARAVLDSLPQECI